MLPLVCNDAVFSSRRVMQLTDPDQVALLFMFDLSRKSTLTSIKNWYKQARLLNKVRTLLRSGRGLVFVLPTACCLYHARYTDITTDM